MVPKSGGDGNERPLLEVGRIARPHGLAGEVVVALTTNRTERLAPGPTRQALLSLIRGAKRNKAFDNCRWIGLAIDGTALVMTHWGPKQPMRYVKE